MTITKDSIIGDILDAYGEVTAPFFLEMGMHCLGCPASRGETVAQACDVHGVDADELVKKLNEAAATAFSPISRRNSGVRKGDGLSSTTF